MLSKRTKHLPTTWIKFGIGIAPKLKSGHGWVLGDMLYRDTWRVGSFAVTVIRCYYRPGSDPTPLTVTAVGKRLFGHIGHR